MNRRGLFLAYLSLCSASTAWALKGDINGDGVRNASDVAALETALNQGIAISSPDADVDSDNLVDNYDLFRLREVVNGLPSSGDPFDLRLPIREFHFATGLNGEGTEPLSVSPYDNPSEIQDFDFPATLQEGSGPRWNVLYDRQGATRMRGCQQTPINIERDKSFEKGDPNRFPGISAFSTYDPSRAYPYNPNPLLNTLNYRKVRLSPDCDTRDDSPNRVPIMLRQYFITTLMRSLKVPTPEVVGFARVNITAPGFDPRQSRENLLFQRADDENDAIPFFQQFGYCFDDPEVSGCHTPTLQETSDAVESNVVRNTVLRDGDWLTTTRWSGQDLNGDRVSSHGYPDFMPLDSDLTVRFHLLQEFAMVNTEDRGPFLNEDYGWSPAEQRWNVIPYDFDFSMEVCEGNTPRKVLELIESFPQAERPPLFAAYARSAREIFDNPNSLNEMLKIIDRYPFSGDKNRLKHTVKARFYAFALYFGSQAFADRIGSAYLPFANRDLYWQALSRLNGDPNFASRCQAQDQAKFQELLSAAPGGLAITTQPSNESVSKGSDAVFQVSANATENLSYQWFFNNGLLTDSDRISGAASPKLTVAHIAPSDAGSYHCLVQTSQGSIATRGALLAVKEPSLLLNPAAASDINIIRPGGSTTAQLGFVLTQPSHVKITVYDRLGNEVIELLNAQQSAGNTIPWDGRDANGNTVPSGVYVAVLKIDDAVDSRKIVVLR